MLLTPIGIMSKNSDEQKGALAILLIIIALIVAILGISGFFAKQKCPGCQTILNGKPSYCPNCKVFLKWSD